MTNLPDHVILSDHGEVMVRCGECGTSIAILAGRDEMTLTQINVDLDGHNPSWSHRQRARPWCPVCKRPTRQTVTPAALAKRILSKSKSAVIFGVVLLALLLLGLLHYGPDGLDDLADDVSDSVND